jgi:hypothetical protein
MGTITKEDYQRWYEENPVTKWVFAAVERAALMQSEAWMDKSWGSGVADPLELITLRARADAYRALFETPFEKLQELNGESDNAN